MLQQSGVWKWFRVLRLLGPALSRQYGRDLTDRCSSTIWFQASSKPSSHSFTSPSRDEKTGALEFNSSPFFFFNSPYHREPLKRPFKKWRPQCKPFFLKIFIIKYDKIFCLFAGTREFIKCIYDLSIHITNFMSLSLHHWYSVYLKNEWLKVFSIYFAFILTSR